ncbi:MAG: L,D-transpeptidase family protein, partial [Bacteroidia bacterium]|nr:L,D-transpeptidase family protein [Bacteroidia bacterium]
YGDYKAYFGPAWLRISYPNSYDAEAAYARKKISKANYNAIVSKNKKRQQPPANTGIGGGIGIHGWDGDWPESTRHLTWGCVSMKNKELSRFYYLIPVGSSIYIVP